MKNGLIIYLVLTGVLLAILSGCATYQGQLDTSVPMTEQVTVLVFRPLTLRSVDGNDVDAGLIGWSPGGFATINIPAGEHELGISYNSIVTAGEYRHEISGYTTVTHEFESGFQYLLSPYTEVLGAKTANVDMMVILELSKDFKISIDKSKKAVSSVAVAYENGVLMGLSMGPVVRVGFDMGILPFGIVVDTGKLSFSFDTAATMSVGWRPNPLKKEFEEAGSLPAGIDVPMAFELAYTGGGLFGAYLNRDNGKAFGLGVGGGYTTSLGTLMDRKSYATGYFAERHPNIDPLPMGVWYIRGAVIPNRSTRFTIYFDYYLKNLVELPLLSKFTELDDDGKVIRRPDENYYNYIMRHPRNWYGWGIGISGKLY